MLFLVMQASELLPEIISTGSFEASKSVLAMRRSVSDSHPFMSRSLGVDEDEEPHTPRAAETHATAAVGDPSRPCVATSPFQEVAVSGLGPQAAPEADPSRATQQSAAGASSQTAEQGRDAATEELAFLNAEADELDATAPAVAAGKAAAADNDTLAEARSAAEGRLRTAALAIRQSSGAEASSRAGSLDLGMLPPREMQVTSHDAAYHTLPFCGQCWECSECRSHTAARPVFTCTVHPVQKRSGAVLVIAQRVIVDSSLGGRRDVAILCLIKIGICQDVRCVLS